MVDNFLRTFPSIQVIAQRQSLISPWVVSNPYRHFPLFYIGKYIEIKKLPVWILFPQTTGETSYHFLTDR